MVTLEKFRKMALAYPETDEHPHFKRIAFRVRKKIFATVAVKDMHATLNLSKVDQSVFCDFDPSVFYPVTGNWGKMGYTKVDLRKVKIAMFRDALNCAYCKTAPVALGKAFKLG